MTFSKTKKKPNRNWAAEYQDKHIIMCDYHRELAKTLNVKVKQKGRAKSEYSCFFCVNGMDTP